MSKRGPSFRPHEDTSVCESWVTVSTDAAVGRYQTETTFYERLLHIHNERMLASGQPLVQRTAVAVASRFSVISQDVAKFVGHFRRVAGPTGGGASGTCASDLKQAATILFESMEKRKFKFETCWYILKDEPKWMATWLTTKSRQPAKRRAERQDVDDEDVDVDEIDHEATSLDDTAASDDRERVGGGTSRPAQLLEPRAERPIGNRRAKAAQVQERLLVRQV
jgi:hypothetical protein